MEERELGDLAQDSFATLCSNRPGLVANPSIRDRRGWDFVLEFPPIGRDMPRDLQLSGETVFVQVKGTESTGPHRVPIKLSNALIFAQRPEPCFFVLFQFEPNKRQPSAVYLKHFWGDIIERTISRVRQAEASGEEYLNRQTLSITFDDGDLVNLEYAIEEILSQIRLISGPYSQEKMRISQFSGLEDGIGPFGLEFEDDVTDDDLVDLCLGLRNSIPTKRLSPRSRRFGVTLPLGTELLNSELSIELQPGIGTIAILTSDGDTLLSSCDVFFPNAFPHIAKDKLRVRVRNNFIDVIISPSIAGGHRFSILFNTTTRMPLHEVEMQIYLMLYAGGRSLDMQFWFHSHLFGQGQCDVPFFDMAGLDGWAAMLDVIGNLKTASIDPRWPRDFALSLNDLVVNKETLGTLEILRSAKTFDLPFVSDEERTGPFVVFILYVGAFVDCHIVSITKHIGELHQETDAESLLRLGKAETETCYILKTESFDEAWKEAEKDADSRASTYNRTHEQSALSIGLTGPPTVIRRSDTHAPDRERPIAVS